MKKIIFILSALFLSAYTANASTFFIEGLEDVPVPDGITQAYDSGVAFGNEESRFVEVYLESSSLNFKDIKSFYQKTMPQLGWAPVKDTQNMISFSRENEIMEIVLEENKPLRIRLTVKSRF